MSVVREEEGEVLARRGQELIQQAEQMLTLGRRLLAEAEGLGVQAPAEPEPEPPRLLEVVREAEVERSTGRHGLVTEQIAAIKARKLGEFTRAEFAEALGLRPPAATRWLAKLVNSEAIVYASGRYTCLLSIPLRDWAIEYKEPFTIEEASEAIRRPLEDTAAEAQGLVARGILSEEEGLYQYLPITDPSPREHPHKRPPEKDPPSYTDVPPRGEPVRIRKDNRKMRSTAGQSHQIKLRQQRYEKLQEAKAQRAEAQKAKARRDPKSKSRGGKRSAA